MGNRSGGIAKASGFSVILGTDLSSYTNLCPPVFLSLVIISSSYSQYFSLHCFNPEQAISLPDNIAHEQKIEALRVFGKFISKDSNS